jgi:hypothetical protein
MKILALIGASTLVVAAGAAQTQVAYTNGPTSGTQSAWTINFGFSVTNSFTLNSATTITGFTFGGWNFQGDTTSAVDWGISTSNDYAISGTALLTAGAATTNGYGFDVRDYSASIAPPTLAAGTYWFSLQNAAVANGDAAYWDINNGPSVAYENNIGNVDGNLFPGTNSTAFTLLTSQAPEPASWALMLIGFSAVGGAMRARKTAVRFA